IIDGHGTAHPRKLGVASWVGIKTKIPSIGIAKDTLLKFDYKSNLAEAENSSLPVHLDGETVGYALRTQESIKAVFVSAGHLISQNQALDVVKRIKGEYRIPEPIRRADQKARLAAKAEIELSLI
ncbi:MAG: endonuclease V, partial [Saprospiraceae bacterium]